MIAKTDSLLIKRQHGNAALVWIILIITLAAFSVRCRQPPAIDQLRAIFESSPDCTAPCWHGITPGKSTESNFLAAMDASTGNHFNALKRNERLTTRDVGYTWHDRPASLLASALIHNDTVSYISFKSNQELKPDSILELLGAPSSYLAFYSPGEINVVVIYLFYEEKGIVVSTVTPLSTRLSTCAFPLTDAAEIKEIFLVSSGPAVEVMSRLPVYFRPTIDKPQPWIDASNISLSSCEK